MNRHLLVLDLDETLIHSTTKEDLGEPDFNLEEWKVYRRPFLKEFLEFCFDRFDVGVWTSAGSLYAQGIINEIAPNRTFEFIWSHSRCTMHFNSETFEHYSRKHLKKLIRKGWDRNRIIAIDDTPSKWEASYGNYVCVAPFNGDQDDTELRDLMVYLDLLSTYQSITSIEKRDWKLRLKAMNPNIMKPIKMPNKSQ